MDELDVFNIGASIKKARKEHGWTQKKLAEKTGLAEITIRQYETNKRTPTPRNLKKIASAFEIDLENPFKTYQIAKISKAISDGIAELEKRNLIDPLDTSPDDLICIDKNYIYTLIDQLNETGLIRMREHLEDLIKIPEYRIDSEPHEPTEEK